MNVHEREGWLTRERLLVLILLAATVLAFYASYLVVKPLLTTLAWALALAIIAAPAHRWISERVRWPDIAAGLTVVLVAVLIIGPVIFVVQQVANQATQAVDQLQAGGAEKLKASIEQNPVTAPYWAWLQRHIDVQEEAKKAGEYITAKATQFLRGTIWVITELMIVLFALFFFFRDRKAALRVARSLMPLNQKETNRVFQRIGDTIHATIFGTIVVAIVQGTLGGLMFWWLGLPGPVLWGAVMALLAIVPVLGAFVVWVPAALFLASQGSWGKAAMLTAWGTIVVGTIDNLLYPALVGKRLRLHTLPVFYAIVGGLMVFGGAGIIIGPLVFAVTVALIDVWRLRTAEGQAAEDALDPREEVKGLLTR